MLSSQSSRLAKSRLFVRSLATTALRRSKQKTATGPYSRRLFSSSENQESNGSGRFSNFLIRSGWVLLGFVALDQALQYKQELEAQEHRSMLRSMQLEANAENQVQWDMSLPTLFTCKITHTEQSLDGTKMLRNCRVGDVVEVMQAETGPNQAYHLCRVAAASNNTDTTTITTRKVGSVGWYPIDYLQKI